MSLPVVFDIDDFSPEHINDEIWDLIFRLRRIYPNLKLNMFTIPMLCPEHWLKWVQKEFPWIEMHYHGSFHKDRNEWIGRDKIELPYLDKPYFKKCFKAPWWNLDQKTVTTLNNMGLVVAHRKFKNPNIHGNLYIYDEGEELNFPDWYANSEYQTWHAHITPQGGPTPTGLQDIWDRLSLAFPMDIEFKFISEVVEC